MDNITCEVVLTPRVTAYEDQIKSDAQRNAYISYLGSWLEKVENALLGRYIARGMEVRGDTVAVIEGDSSGDLRRFGDLQVQAELIVRLRDFEHGRGEVDHKLSELQAAWDGKDEMDEDIEKAEKVFQISLNNLLRDRIQDSGLAFNLWVTEIGEYQIS